MEIKATTGIYGIFGHPVSQSLSPAMHNRAFSLLGMDCVYLAFDVEPRDAEAAVDSLRTLGIRGVNVTVPHKRAVMTRLDEISPEASLAGAVNTIENRDGKLVGRNTDVSGLLRALSSELGFDPRGKNVLLVGAGGAARAAAAGMCAGGAREVAVVNRTPGRARELCGEFSPRFPEVGFRAAALGDAALVAETVARADIVINSSCAGMEGREPLALPLDLLPKDSPRLRSRVQAPRHSARERRPGPRASGRVGPRHAPLPGGRRLFHMDRTRRSSGGHEGGSSRFRVTGRDFPFILAGYSGFQVRSREGL